METYAVVIGTLVSVVANFLVVSFWAGKITARQGASEQRLNRIERIIDKNSQFEVSNVRNI